MAKHINFMERRMQNPENNNPAMAAQMIIKVMQAGDVSSFAAFERCLASLESKIRLVAIPLDMQQTPGLVLWHPIQRTDLPTHKLYIATNGQPEYDAVIESLNIDPSSNIKNLHKTGIVVTPYEGDKSEDYYC